MVHELPVDAVEDRLEVVSLARVLAVIPKSNTGDRGYMRSSCVSHAWISSTKRERRSVEGEGRWGLPCCKHLPLFAVEHADSELRG